MGPFMAVMAIISMAASFAQAKQQGDLAEKQAANSAAMARMQIDELTRQQKEVNEAAQADKGERARQADKEFASLVVSFAERGGLGTVNALRGGQEVGFNAGVDRQRIEANRQRQIDALQSKKTAAQYDALGAIQTAQATKKSAMLGALGSSMQIGSSAVVSGARINAAKGTVS